MKIASFAVAAVGIMALLAGLGLKVTGHAYGLATLGVGVVLLILGLVGVLVPKPKTQAS